MNDDDADRWRQAIARETDEVTIMELTWAERMEAKGIRHTLLRFLERRFGPLPATLRERLDAIDDPETLDRLSDKAFDATSLDELGLATD